MWRQKRTTKTLSKCKNWSYKPQVRPSPSWMIPIYREVWVSRKVSRKHTKGCNSNRLPTHVKHIYISIELSQLNSWRRLSIHDQHRRLGLRLAEQLSLLIVALTVKHKTGKLCTTMGDSDVARMCQEGWRNLLPRGQLNCWNGVLTGYLYYTGVNTTCYPRLIKFPRYQPQVSPNVRVPPPRRPTGLRLGALGRLAFARPLQWQHRVRHTVLS